MTALYCHLVDVIVHPIMNDGVTITYLCDTVEMYASSPTRGRRCNGTENLVKGCFRPEADFRIIAKPPSGWSPDRMQACLRVVVPATVH